MIVNLILRGQPYDTLELDCIPQVGQKLLLTDPSGRNWDCSVEDVLWVIDDSESKNRKSYVDIQIDGPETLL